MNSTNSTFTSDSTTTQPLSASFSALISVSYFLLFVASLVLYTIVFVAIAKNRKDFSSPYYKYIASLAIGELLYAVYYGVFGALCNALTDCPVSMFANTLISGLTYPGWPIESSTDVAIAFDRFIAVCFYSKYKTICSGKKLPFAIIAATWLYAAMYAFPFYSLLVPLYYELRDAVELSDSAHAPLVGYVQMCADAVMLGSSALFYTVTFVVMWKRRRQDVVGNGAMMRRIQRRMLMQGCGHLLMVAFSDILYYGYVLPYSNSIVVSYISVLLYVLIPFKTCSFCCFSTPFYRRRLAPSFAVHTTRLRLLATVIMPLL